MNRVFISPNHDRSRGCGHDFSFDLFILAEVFSTDNGFHVLTDLSTQFVVGLVARVDRVDVDVFHGSRPDRIRMVVTAWFTYQGRSQGVRGAFEYDAR